MKKGNTLVIVLVIVGVYMLMTGGLSLNANKTLGVNPPTAGVLNNLVNSLTKIFSDPSTSTSPAIDTSMSQYYD